MDEYTVCCTGQGTHGRVDFPALLRDGDTLTERLAHSRPAPWSADAKITPSPGEDPEAAPRRYVAVAATARRDFDGEERWEWTCPKCRQPRRLTGAKVRAWLAFGDTRGRVLDVSLLPMR